MAVVADAAGSQVKSSRGLDSETRSVHSDKRKRIMSHYLTSFGIQESKLKKKEDPRQQEPKPPGHTG